MVMERATVYYISDLHLERWMDLGEVDSAKIRKVEQLIDDLLASCPDTFCPLLVAGDVVRRFDLAVLFYKKLKERWKGPVVSVLGNHELMDWASPVKRDADGIIQTYRVSLGNCGVRLLENDLLIQLNDGGWRSLSEKEILEMGEEELTGICRASCLLILGGVGYAGKNQYFNASHMIYYRNLTREEEVKRSERFEALYCKVLRCATGCRMIVMTHMEPHNWTERDCHSGCVYICGHSHRNRRIVEDGHFLLADNQSAAKPERWKLSCFSVNDIRVRPEPLSEEEEAANFL